MSQLLGTTDLVISQLTTVNAIAGMSPGTTQLLYTNVSTLYQGLLSDWLNFADAAGVPAQIALCGGRGGLNLGVDYASLDLEEQVKLVLAAWQNALPCLLIFDNCEDPALLERWICISATEAASFGRG